MSDNKLVTTVVDAATLTGLAAGIGWIAKKAFRKSFTGGGGAVLNAAAFIGGNYLTRALSGCDDGDAALKEKVHHEKALEAYQAAYAKYMRDHTRLLDWIATNAQIKEQTKQNFTNTDFAFKLYNKVHPEERMVPPKEPKFSDFYVPSEQQKQGELVFLGAGALALGYVAFWFL